MRETILSELTKLDQTNNVQVIYAVESGSRAWGFESPDSDYDVRFIYVRPQDDYLRIDRVRDVIDWQPDPLFDATGWDLPKTLRLMRKSNPSLYEWAASPIVYRSTPTWELLGPMLDRCFSPRAIGMHYLSMARRNREEHLLAPTVKLKKYLYVLRPILACRWLVERGTMPPVRFSDLVEAELPQDLKPSVDDLLARKRAANEAKRIEHMPDIDSFIERGLADMDGKIRELPKAEDVPWEDLDARFREILQRG